MPEQKECDYYEGRRSAGHNERVTFEPQWKELAQFAQPRKGRFFIQDHNKGDRRYNSIINSKATRALRVARAGLLAGVMSPSQPSFTYETPDPDLNNFMPVKLYMARMAMINRTIMTSGNLYSMAPAMLGELLLFGTGCMSHVDDFDDVARFYTHTIGSYYLAQNEKFKIDTLIREFEQQTNQIIAQHGYNNVSQSVKNAYDRGNYDTWFPVVHFTAPNRDYRPTMRNSRYKLFESVYYEPGEVSKDQYLSRKGFDAFSAYCPRWDVTGEDVYATDCPGMTTLGDVKGLQIQEKRKAQAIDKMVSPPLKGPASLKNVPVASIPGGLTVYDADSSKEGLSPIYTVNPQVGELRIDSKALEDRIDDGFYVKLFLAISEMEGIQPRNELDLKMRDQERLLQLGDPLQRLYDEFLSQMHDRLIDQGFAAGRKQGDGGIYGPPPQELQGKQIKPRYIGPLALAQRAQSVSAIERHATFVSGLVAGGFPHASDKFDADRAVEIHADLSGVPPELVVPDDVVSAHRQAEAQAADAQAKLSATGAVADAAQKGASAANQLANAPMQGGNSNALEAIQNAIKQRANPNAFTPGK